MKRVKGVRYVVTGRQALGAEHTMGNTDDVLRNCTLETYIILVTCITPINLILKIDSSRNRKSD